MLFNHGFRHPRLFIKIVQVGIGNQFVQIFQSYPVLSQNNNVVGSLFLVVNGSVLANAVPVLQQISFYPIEDLDVLSGMGSVGEEMCIRDSPIPLCEFGCPLRTVSTVFNRSTPLLAQLSKHPWLGGAIPRSSFIS